MCHGESPAGAELRWNKSHIANLGRALSPPHVCGTAPQVHLENLTFACLKEEDLRLHSDHTLVKLFRLAQLTLEYLLNVQVSTHTHHNTCGHNTCMCQCPCLHGCAYLDVLERQVTVSRTCDVATRHACSYVYVLERQVTVNLADLAPWLLCRTPWRSSSRSRHHVVWQPPPSSNGCAHGWVTHAGHSCGLP